MIILYRIMGFLIMASYLRVVPALLPQGVGFWLLYAAGAIVLGRHVVRLVGLGGLAECGAHTHYGWKRNIRLGLMLGFLIWAALYLYTAIAMLIAMYAGPEPSIETIVHILSLAGQLGAQQVEVYSDLSFHSLSSSELMMELPVWVLAPLLYELLIRGYLYAHLGSKLSIMPFMFLSSGICAIETVWSTGFDAWDTTLAFAIGLPLSYALYRTGAIWLSAGMHMAISLAGSIWEFAARDGSTPVLLWPPASLIASLILLWGTVLLLKRCRVNVHPAVRDRSIRS